MKHGFAITLMIAMSACASVHPGEMARRNDGSSPLPLDVSVNTIDVEKGSPFQLVQVTYENTSDDWVRISKAEALTGDSAKNHINVVVGKDLVAWAEAVAAKEDLERQNQEILQTTALVAGAATSVAGAASGNETLETAGLAVVMGTSVWAAADVFSARKRQANSPRLIPESHLYAETIVPPKMFIRRWILFSKPTNTLLPWVVFSVETAEGKKATYTLQMNQDT